MLLLPLSCMFRSQVVANMSNMILCMLVVGSNYKCEHYFPFYHEIRVFNPNALLSQGWRYYHDFLLKLLLVNRTVSDWLASWVQPVRGHVKIAVGWLNILASFKASAVFAVGGTPRCRIHRWVTMGNGSYVYHKHEIIGYQCLRLKTLVIFRRGPLNWSSSSKFRILSYWLLDLKLVE